MDSVQAQQTKWMFQKDPFYLNTCTNHELSFDIGKHLFSVTAGWHQASGFDISSYFELK